MAIKDIVKGICNVTRCKYDVYTKERTDELLEAKANSEEVYTKEETEQLIKPTTLWSGNQNIVTKGPITLNDNISNYDKIVIYYSASIIINSKSEIVYRSIEIPVEDGIIFNLNHMNTGSNIDVNGAVSSFQYFYQYLNAQITSDQLSVCNVESGKSPVGAYGIMIFGSDNVNTYMASCGISIRRIDGYKY